jgi:cell wall-associated NlpC family hydrolase
VTAAKKAAASAANTPYTPGGKTLSGFDCSGFVAYAFQQVFPEYEYLSSEGIVGSSLFEKVTTAQAGDVIYFPAGQNPYEMNKGNTEVFPAHVGIIVNETEWIGRQTSKLGIVLRANPWWAARGGVRYYRYKGLQLISIHYRQHLSSRIA